LKLKELNMNTQYTRAVRAIANAAIVTASVALVFAPAVIELVVLR